MSNILHLEQLSKVYRNKNRVNDNINLELMPKQITALIGHNGAGKSTLLGQISGLVKSTEGQVRLGEINLSENSSKARELVSTMPQLQAPLKSVSMQETIESIGMIKGLSIKESKKQTADLIEYFKLEKYKNISGENLSGGLQRLTSFAMSVIKPAQIVLLDEPTNDVDPIRRILIWKYMRKLANEGKIVIVVSHNLLEVEKYADRYILLEKGKVIDDVSTSKNNNNRVKHLLEVEGISLEHTEKYYSKYTDKIYDKDFEKVSIFLEKSNLEEAVKEMLVLLEENKIINYNLKIANLNDTYGGRV